MEKFQFSVKCVRLNRILLYSQFMYFKLYPSDKNNYLVALQPHGKESLVVFAL